MELTPTDDFLAPFGISADSGRPINDLSDEAVAAMIGKGPEPQAQVLLAKANPEAHYGVIGGTDPNKLDESGWGVIFAPGVDQKIKDALGPLIEHRKAKATPFVIYDGPTSVRPGESVQDWLARQKVRMDVVDPDKGVPFYLLIV